MISAAEKRGSAGEVRFPGETLAPAQATHRHVAAQVRTDLPGALHLQQPTLDLKQAKLEEKKKTTHQGWGLQIYTTCTGQTAGAPSQKPQEVKAQSLGVTGLRAVAATEHMVQGHPARSQEQLGNKNCKGERRSRGCCGRGGKATRGQEEARPSQHQHGH